MSKFLLITGAALIALGLLSRVLPLFRLPGDIRYQGEHFSLYIPITTGIIFSIIISLLLYLFRR